MNRLKKILALLVVLTSPVWGPVVMFATYGFFGLMFLCDGFRVVGKDIYQETLRVLKVEN